jgi:hypothetical protein
MSIFINQMLLNNLITKINLLEQKINSYDEKINLIQNILNENNKNFESKINLIQSSISNQNYNIQNIQDDNIKIINSNKIHKSNDSNEIKCGKSLYNTFMKEEIEKLKLEKPELLHKEIFKLAANNWKESDKNLKNQK